MCRNEPLLIYTLYIKTMKLSDGYEYSDTTPLMYEIYIKSNAFIARNNFWSHIES